MPIKDSLAIIRQSKVRVRDHETVAIGDDCTLDLSGVEQLVEASQTRAIVDAISYAEKNSLTPTKRDLQGVVNALDAVLDKTGLDALSAQHLGTYARPRKFEVAAAFNRLRVAQFQQ